MDARLFFAGFLGGFRLRWCSDGFLGVQMDARQVLVVARLVLDFRC